MLQVLFGIVIKPCSQLQFLFWQFFRMGEPSHTRRTLEINPHKYHKKLPSCSQDIPSKLLFHHLYQYEFKTYIDYMTQKYPLVDVCPIPVLRDGKYTGRTITDSYVTTLYRLIIKMMIWFVVDQQLKNYSLTQFT